MALQTAAVVSEPEETVDRPHGPSRRAAVGSVLLGTGVIAWHGSYYGSWIVDDAAITFAYARSFADGLGPVLHPGADAAEGYSNPSWLAVLVTGRLFGLFDRGTLFGVPDYVLFPKFIAVLCCAAILTICFSVARRVTARPGLAVFAVAVVLAAIPSFVIWCFSGLENPLFALAVVGLAAVLFHAVLDHGLDSPRVAVLAGLLCALAALTRPDGLIYLLAYPLLVRRWPPVLLSCGVFAVPFGSYLVWRYLTFGLLVPNTAVAKRQGLPAPDDLLRLGELMTYAGTILPVVLVVAVVAARKLEGLPALVVPLVLAMVAYAVLEPDWMGQHRFATPVWALSALVGVLAVARVLNTVPCRATIVSVLVGALVVSGSGFANAAERFHDRPTFPMCLVAKRFGRMFNQYADILELQRASLLLPDLGGTAMTTRLHLVDLAGLTDARIAEYTRDGDRAGLRDYVFDEAKPTFIASHGVWNGGTGVVHDPRLRRDYFPIHRHYNVHNHGGSSEWVRKDAVRSGHTAGGAGVRGTCGARSGQLGP